MMITDNTTTPETAPNIARPEVKPRNLKHWTYTLSICSTKYASAKESAMLKSAFTVFLGQNGSFDYWGSPKSGRVISVGVPEFGTYSSHYGDRRYWASRHTMLHSHWTEQDRLTEAGKNWGKGNP